MKLSHLELFQNLVNLAASDGKFTEEEVLYLAQRAEQWGISNDEFESCVAGLMEGALEIRLPETQAKREELLAEMIRLMAVDGQLAETEKRLCATASAKMDFTTVEFRQLLDRVLAHCASE
ncbi:MAG: hypothetical protein ACK493_03835 [Planctomycetota bacterium]|jgi:uncharacterized tellurite resistance protein B-like protein|nr:TerB family tellurite resistance protein [Blastopirellula sp.]